MKKENTQNLNADEMQSLYNKYSETMTIKGFWDKEPSEFKFLLLEQHTEKNPLVVENYPYGFHYRTQIRYYIETTKRGDRFVSQTLNPKSNIWNKPKKSTYTDIMILIADEKGHVTRTTLDFNDSIENIKQFEKTFYNILTDIQKNKLIQIKAYNKVMNKVTYTIRETTHDTPSEREANDKKQKEISKDINKAINYEIAKAKGGLN